jgi:hypothetical protein
VAQPYLDSAGNVNPAIANDVQNLVFAMRQQVAISGNPPPAAVAVAAAQVAADNITGLTSAAVTDV